MLLLKPQLRKLITRHAPTVNTKATPFRDPAPHGIPHPTCLPGCTSPSADPVCVPAALTTTTTTLRDGFSYDFSRDYVGPAGLGPLVTALRLDPSFTSLTLAHCGLYDAAAVELAQWLAGHSAITALDLAGNRIGDRGGEALAGLLRANPGITVLELGGNHLMRWAGGGGGWKCGWGGGGGCQWQVYTVIKPRGLVGLVGSRRGKAPSGPGGVLPLRISWLVRRAGPAD